jgi:hypothetical protein
MCLKKVVIESKQIDFMRSKTTNKKLYIVTFVIEFLNPTKKRMKTTLVGLREKPTLLFTQKDYFGFKSGNSIEIWSENGEFMNMMNLKN